MQRLTDFPNYRWFNIYRVGARGLQGGIQPERLLMGAGGGGVALAWATEQPAGFHAPGWPDATGLFLVLF